MKSSLRFALPALPLALQALPNADAQIIYTDPADITLQPGSGSIYFDVNLDGGGNAARTTFFAGADFNLYFTGGGAGSQPYLLNYPLSSAAGDATPWGGTLLRLDAGDAVDATLGFNTFGGFINENGSNDENWAAGTTGFLGLKLRFGGEDHFGWARLTYAEDLALTLHDFAYNATANAAIAAGDTGRFTPVPEASTMWAGAAVLLAGSAAVYRKRRQTPAA